MSAGLGFADQRPAAREQREARRVREPLHPGLEAVEVLGHLAQPIGPNRGLDRVGQRVHEQRVGFVSCRGDRGQQTVERRRRPPATEVEQPQSPLHVGNDQCRAAGCHQRVQLRGVR